MNIHNSNWESILNLSLCIHTGLCEHREKECWYMELLGQLYVLVTPKQSWNTMEQLQRLGIEPMQFWNAFFTSSLTTACAILHYTIRIISIQPTWMPPINKVLNCQLNISSKFLKRMIQFFLTILKKYFFVASKEHIREHSYTYRSGFWRVKYWLIIITRRLFNNTLTTGHSSVNIETLLV